MLFYYVFMNVFFLMKYFEVLQNRLKTNKNPDNHRESIDLLAQLQRTINDRVQ